MSLDDLGYLSVAEQAEYYLAAAQAGYERWGVFDGETLYGKIEGFVYFISVGDPYVTHVKIGFTSKNPFSRLKELQTGCPFKMSMLGFVVGNRAQEAELHDVVKEDCSHGEWFVYNDYVAGLIADQLRTEMPDE